jgi:hypothetical protein
MTMKRSLMTTGLGFLLAAVAPACGGQEAGLALPGDVDDSPEGGGKGDEWNGENDPSNLSTHLQYKLAELPKSGKIETPVWSKRFQPLADDPVMWSDTYWPSAEGSTNVRWLGAEVRSPLEKYDLAFNDAAGCESQPAARCGADAKQEWDEYLGCAGPAAKWHATNFHGSRQMYDVVDSDGDGEVDECGSDQDGI